MSDSTKLAFLRGSNWPGLSDPSAFRRGLWAYTCTTVPAKPYSLPDVRPRRVNGLFITGPALTLLSYFQSTSLLPAMSVPVCPSLSVPTSTCHNKPKSKFLGLPMCHLSLPPHMCLLVPDKPSPPTLLLQAHGTSQPPRHISFLTPKSLHLPFLLPGTPHLLLCPW